MNAKKQEQTCFPKDLGIIHLGARIKIADAAKLL